MSEDDEVAIW